MASTVLVTLSTFSDTSFDGITSRVDACIQTLLGGFNVVQFSDTWFLDTSYASLSPQPTIQKPFRSFRVIADPMPLVVEYSFYIHLEALHLKLSDWNPSLRTTITSCYMTHWNLYSIQRSPELRDSSERFRNNFKILKQKHSLHAVHFQVPLKWINISKASEWAQTRLVTNITNNPFFFSSLSNSFNYFWSLSASHFGPSKYPTLF